MTDNDRGKWLVEPAWLAEHLGDRDLRIVDMRGAVETSTDGEGRQSASYRGLRDEYAAGHIPGAVFLDWTRDIVDPGDPVPAQAARPEQIAAVLGEAGIGDETLVVAYDTHPSSQFATRLWWLLRYYGHDRVQVLDGGLKGWLREGHEVTTEVPHPAMATFTPRVRPAWRTTAEEVLESIGDPDTMLADARDAAQYTNAVRRGPRGGHIPGALHIPREAMVNEEGRFRSNEELSAAARAAGLDPDQRIVAYCNGGVAATSVLFGLSLIGYPRLANYDGSWNEWTARDDLPVEG